MAYPTGVSYQHVGQSLGMQGVHETSTTQLHPLGTVSKVRDATYMEGEAIYLVGVASTAQGDLCCYNSKTGATVRAVIAGTGSNGSAGVALSANVASQYGWYLIRGSTPVKSGTVAAHGQLYMTSTASTIDDAVSVDAKIDGMVARAADSGGYTTCELNYPSVTADPTTAALAAASALITTAQATADAAMPKTSVLKCTLVAGAEGAVAANTIEIAGTVEDMAGLDTAAAKQVYIKSLAVTADKGDLAAAVTPVGTVKKAITPATGPNELWMETTAAGLFSFSVANDVAEETVVTVITTTGIATTLKLTFA
jgi:hypothetical protein